MKKALWVLVLLSVLPSCVLRNSAGSRDGLSAAHAADARALAGEAADVLQERQAPAHTRLELKKAPGLFGEALESELRGRGFAVMPDGGSGLGVSYVADIADGQGFVQISCSDGQRFSFTRPLGLPPQKTITEPPNTRPVSGEAPVEERELNAPAPDNIPALAGQGAPAAPARMARVRKTGTALSVATRNGIPVEDFCRWNQVGKRAVLEAGCEVYLSEPPAGTIAPAAPAAIPAGVAALEKRPVPPQTALPTPAQISPRLTLEKPEPAKKTHYTPAPMRIQGAEVVSAGEPAETRVVETIAPGGEMISVETASLPQWNIQQGRMLREQLENWAGEAGYTLIWSAQNDYEMKSSASFPGVFIEAVKNLFSALQASGLALRVTIYQGNNVMEVSEH